MKDTLQHGFKKVLALLIALLITVPAFADEAFIPESAQTLEEALGGETSDDAVFEGEVASEQVDPRIAEAEAEIDGGANEGDVMAAAVEPDLSQSDEVAAEATGAQDLYAAEPMLEAFTKKLLVTADDKTKVQGEADPDLTYSVEGLAEGDALTGSLTRDPGEAVGEYAITQGTLSAPEGYELVFTPARLTITAEGAPKPAVSPTAMPIASIHTNGNTALKLAWTPVEGADGYDVFFVSCSVHYADEPIYSIPAGEPLSCDITGLKKGNAYTAYVKAWQAKDGTKTYVGKASPSVHVIAGGFSRQWCNAKKVVVEKAGMTLAIGQIGKIKASVKGVKKNRKVLNHEGALRYYSSDTGVATVSGGAVKAVGEGSCTVTVMANDGVSATVTVNVTTDATGSGPRKVAFARVKKRSIRVGSTLNMEEKVKFTPASAATVLLWRSSDPAVADVDQSGAVTGVKPGKATITVVTANGRKAKIKLQVTKNNTVVFFGDSLTARASWQPYFKGKKIVNLGISGNTLRQMNERVRDIASAAPEKVFILGGINSLFRMPLESAVKDYETLLDSVGRQLPGAQVYLLSVLPIADSLQTAGATNANILEFNREIQALAAEKGFEYIDIYHCYVKDGQLNPAYTADGLHLKKKAYKYWAREIKNSVKQ